MRSTDKARVTQLAGDGAYNEAFGLIAAPLHEALYEAQSFDLMDTLNATDRLVLAFDYVQQQVQQGGFIQLIQNGYISLLVTVIEALQELNLDTEMAAVLDDALKVFVLNNEALLKETTVAAFGKLYEEFREFEGLEDRFNAVRPVLLKAVTERYLHL